MKSNEERLAAIEAELAAIPRRGKWLTVYERDLREAALQFARVKDHGFYIEQGSRRRIDPTEKEDFLRLFTDRMKMYAVEMLIEMGMETPRE